MSELREVELEIPLADWSRLSVVFLAEANELGRVQMWLLFLFPLNGSVATLDSPYGKQCADVTFFLFFLDPSQSQTVLFKQR